MEVGETKAEVYRLPSAAARNRPEFIITPHAHLISFLLPSLVIV